MVVVVDAVEVEAEEEPHSAAVPAHLLRSGVKMRGWQADWIDSGSGLVPRTSWTGSHDYQRSH